MDGVPICPEKRSMTSLAMGQELDGKIKAVVMSGPDEDFHVLFKTQISMNKAEMPSKPPMRMVRVIGIITPPY